MGKPENEGSFLRRGEVALYHRTMYPTGSPPRASVAIVHGLGEHSGRHLRLAELLVSQGYAVLLHDLRGHGKSGGLRGHVDRFEEYLEDLHALLEKRDASLPVYLLGHSFGGLVAACYVADYPEGLSGVILSSPALRTAMEVPPWKARLASTLSRIAPRFRLATGLPLDGLSHDPQVAATYSRDPLCSSKVSARFYTETLRRQLGTLDAAARIHVPVLIMQAGADKVVDPLAAAEFHAALVVADKRLVIYDKAYHEIFNDFCQEEARAEVASWLADHVGGAPDKSVSSLKS